MLAINMEYVANIQLMGFVSYKTPWIHFKRNTNEHILYLIKSGELHMRENGIPHVLKKGDILLLEPDMDHEGIEKHFCDYYYIHFLHPDFKPQSVADVPALARRVILEEGSQEALPDGDICYFPKRFTLINKTSMNQTFHSLNEMLQLYRRKHFNRSLIALKFSELCIEISREHLLTELRRDDSRNTKSFMKVHAMLDYIHQHYSQKITAREIEQQFECNYDYINRIFNKVTGHTITRYVNRVRINHAKELIEATHMGIGEIGYLVGLSDPYYFSKVFKKYVGVSPVHYYKKIREDY